MEGRVGVVVMTKESLSYKCTKEELERWGLWVSIVWGKVHKRRSEDKAQRERGNRERKKESKQNKRGGWAEKKRRKENEIIC